MEELSIQTNLEPMDEIPLLKLICNWGYTWKTNELVMDLWGEYFVTTRAFRTIIKKRKDMEDRVEPFLAGILKCQFSLLFCWVEVRCGGSYKFNGVFLLPLLLGFCEGSLFIIKTRLSRNGVER